MAEEQRTTVGTTQAPSPASPEETMERIATGLGSSRYKEYGVAAYAQIVQAAVPRPLWSGVLFSWMSMKGHLQGLHMFDRSQLFATLVGEVVYVTFVVVWDDADALAEWMQHGYSVEEMLRAMGIAEEDIHVQLTRDFS